MNNVFSLGWRLLCYCFPRVAVRIQYRHIMGRKINLSNPKDINEKINYLKFHANQVEWARLADKFAVREYVKGRGLGEFLIPLYGKYDSGEELIDDWENLPDSFVIKSNHGCGTVKLVHNKHLENLFKIKEEMDEWLKMKFGVDTNEPHYRLIKPCIIVEKLLADPKVNDYSCSLIDYKVWCFNGKPYCFFIGVDRHIDGMNQTVKFDAYDTEWNRIVGVMTDAHELPPLLPKPKNLQNLLKCASILSKGHKQVRVDLYDIDGKIYFGEMTFTSQGGYMDYFTQEFLLELGSQFDV